MDSTTTKNPRETTRKRPNQGTNGDDIIIQEEEDEEEEAEDDEAPIVRNPSSCLFSCLLLLRLWGKLLKVSSTTQEET